MWTMLLLLWSVPLALGILVLARVAEGSPALSGNESQLFFGDSKDMTLSPWMALEFVVLALLFFILGIFEGLVLANFGALWLVVVPLLTALGAMLILAYCLRSAPRARPVPQPKPARPDPSQSRTDDLFTRWKQWTMSR